MRVPRSVDYPCINVYWFALPCLWNTIHPIVARKTTNIASALLGAVSALLLIFARGKVLVTIMALDLNDVLLFGSIIGLSAGVFLSIDWALATDIIPGEEVPSYLGVSNLATAGAGLLAGFGGPLINLFNARQRRLGYTALFAAACPGYLVGASWLLKNGEKGKEN